jgi:hypothetical protein
MHSMSSGDIVGMVLQGLVVVLLLLVLDRIHKVVKDRPKNSSPLVCALVASPADGYAV